MTVRTLDDLVDVDTSGAAVGKALVAVDLGGGRIGWAPATISGGGGPETDPLALKIASNLSDLANAGQARTNLGLGTAAVANKVAAGSAGVLDATDASTTNARTPTAHHASHEPGGTDALTSYEQSANKNQPNGYPGLDSGGLLPTSVLPALSISETFVVASQAAMLALTAQRGDVAIRTDVGKSFILSTDSPGTLADWKELSAAGAVTSVNGQTGAVSGLASDAAVVHLTGAETVAGVKTFSSSPVVPDDSFPEAKVTGLTTDLAAKVPKALGTAKGSLVAFTASGTPAEHAAGSNGQRVIYDSAQSDGLKNVDDVRLLRFVIDGGGSTITTGAKKVYLTVPVDCTITKARLLADVSGSVVIDVWKDTYANFPPTVADTIVASAKPTLSSAQKSEDSTLTGWTTTLTAGDVLEINVDSATTVTKVYLDLFVRPR